MDHAPAPAAVPVPSDNPEPGDFSDTASLADAAGLADLRAWAAGDEAAFTRFVNRYQGLVEAACSRQVHPGDVDDAVQAVFLVLLRRRQEAAAAPVPAAWLLAVAWRVCRSASRARRRRRTAEISAGQEQQRLRPPPDSATHDPVRGFLRGHLDQALQALPQRQRCAVIGHYLEGRSQAELAQLLALNENACKQLIHRGITNLRAWMGRHGPQVTAALLISVFARESYGAESLAAMTAGQPPTPSPAAQALANSVLHPTAGYVALVSGCTCAAAIACAVALSAHVQATQAVRSPMANPAPLVLAAAEPEKVARNQPPEAGISEHKETPMRVRNLIPSLLISSAVSATGGMAMAAEGTITIDRLAITEPSGAPLFTAHVDHAKLSDVLVKISAVTEVPVELAPTAVTAGNWVVSFDRERGGVVGVVGSLTQDATARDLEVHVERSGASGAPSRVVLSLKNGGEKANP